MVAAEYVCVPVVVTSAPKLDTPLTLNEVASVIAAFKSRAPVIAIAPTAWLPPTIPSKLISVELPPVASVKFLLVLFALLTVSSNVITSLLVVKVTAALKVTAPV